MHGQLVFAIACAWLAVRYSLALWILTPLLGCFREVLWPLGYAWADHYITLFGVIVGLKNMLIMLMFYEGDKPRQVLLYADSFKEVIFIPAVGCAILLCVSPSRFRPASTGTPDHGAG